MCPKRRDSRRLLTNMPSLRDFVGHGLYGWTRNIFSVKILAIRVTFFAAIKQYVMKVTMADGTTFSDKVVKE